MKQQEDQSSRLKLWVPKTGTPRIYYEHGVVHNRKKVFDAYIIQTEEISLGHRSPLATEGHDWALKFANEPNPRTITQSLSDLLKQDIANELEKYLIRRLGKLSTAETTFAEIESITRVPKRSRSAG